MSHYFTVIEQHLGLWMDMYSTAAAEDKLRYLCTFQALFVLFKNRKYFPNTSNSLHHSFSTLLPMRDIYPAIARLIYMNRLLNVFEYPPIQIFKIIQMSLSSVSLLMFWNWEAPWRQLPWCFEAVAVGSSDGQVALCFIPGNPFHPLGAKGPHICTKLRPQSRLESSQWAATKRPARPAAVNISMFSPSFREPLAESLFQSVGQWNRVNSGGTAIPSANAQPVPYTLWHRKERRMK